MMLDADQDYAGIYIETGGAALEVEVQPGLFIDGPVEPNENQTVSAQHPLLVFRSMSNFVLLHLFVGPTPKEVTNQLTKYIGKPRQLKYFIFIFRNLLSQQLLETSDNYVF
jgi:hypothetical protein